MKFLLLLPIVFTSIPSHAITWKEFWEPFDSEIHVYQSPPMCRRRVYREQYVPGTEWNPGYVRRWYDVVRQPCSSRY
jgi:hypothetical protein